MKLIKKVHALLSILIGLDLTTSKLLDEVEELQHCKELSIRLGEVMKVEDLSVIPSIKRMNA